MKKFIILVALCAIGFGLTAQRTPARRPAPARNTQKESAPVKQNPVIGSIVMKDGTFKQRSEINASNRDDAIAVVFRVNSGRVMAVGKVHAKKAWCSADADANGICIDALVTEADDRVPGKQNFQPTSHNFGIYAWRDVENAPDVYDMYEKDKYPAWYFCNDYGTTNCPDTDFTDGWYFPALMELCAMWEAKSEVDASLQAIGGQKFGNNQYISSSHVNKSRARDGKVIWSMSFRDCALMEELKTSDLRYVCAVRLFDY